MIKFKTKKKEITKILLKQKGRENKSAATRAKKVTAKEKICMKERKLNPVIFRGVIECVQKTQFLHNFARTDQAERAKVNIKLEGEEATE